MLYFGEDNRVHKIESIETVPDSKYFWVLNLKERDFMLKQLAVLETRVLPLVTVKTPSGITFDLPASWYVLIVDLDTTQIDVVRLSMIGGKLYDIFTFGPDMLKPTTSHLQIIDYKQSGEFTTCSINSHEMLCHAIDGHRWINISPSVSNVLMSNLTSYWDIV